MTKGTSMTEGEDLVNYPSHYCGNIECIAYIEETLGSKGFQGFLQGNIVKYLHRWRRKGGLEDLRKAQFYLNRLVDRVEVIGEQVSKD